MKITIEKRGENSYRIRKRVNGHLYLISLDYEPTEFDAIRELNAAIEQRGADRPERITFDAAAGKYIEEVDGVLSASTIREYTRLRSVIRETYPNFARTKLANLRQDHVQSMVNRHTKSGRSPKTVRNLHAFVSSVLSAYRPSLVLHTSLPALKRKEEHIPSDEDIKAVLGAVRGSKYWIPFSLGCCGMRRSEICALSPEDLRGDMLYVHGAMVHDRENRWVLQDRTKTPESTRLVAIPAEVAAAIREQGYVYHGSPDSLHKQLTRVQDRIGVQRFSFHKLRHYFASSAHALGVPDAYIMAAGGWKTDNVMKTVYRHVMDEKQKEMEQRTIAHLSSLIG